MNDDEDLSRLIHTHATRYRANRVLESSIRAEIALQSAAAPRQLRLPRWRWPVWSVAAASFACGALLTVAAMLLVRPTVTAEHIETELVANHIRALMVAHLTDVTSSDQHTVKPWFQGRLDYAPPVRDLRSEGFPLVGGRLDYLSSRAVAALVYRRRDHVINVFVWPGAGAGAEPPTLAVRQGYNVLQWRAGGMQYWAVSDVAAEDLRTLGRLLP
jgi:anti-sigma factor RsiW